MAVAVDFVHDFGGFVSTSPLTGSHTSTGATNVLYVVVNFWNSGGTVSTVTFGAQSLTNVVRSSLTANNDRTEIWRLIAPTAGTATITVTFSAAADGDAYSVSVTGGDQTTPERSVNSTIGSQGTGTGTASISLASAAAGDMAIDGLTLSDRTRSITMLAHTGRVQRSNNTTATGEGGAGSTMTSPAAPQVMDWTLGAFGVTTTWAMGGVIVAAAAAGSGLPPGLGPSESMQPAMTMPIGW